MSGLEPRRRGQASGVPRRAAVIAVSAALAAAVAACGDAASSGPERARDTVESFLAACAREETAAVLALLTAAERKRFVEAQDTLASILVEGDAGTATLSMPGSEAGHVDLDEHGLTWRIHTSPEGS